MCFFLLCEGDDRQAVLPEAKVNYEDQSYTVASCRRQQCGEAAVARGVAAAGRLEGLAEAERAAGEADHTG